MMAGPAGANASRRYYQTGASPLRSIRQRSPQYIEQTYRSGREITGKLI